MKASGTFTSSNPLINQLQHNIQWGQRGNFLDVPTDCPQRDERLDGPVMHRHFQEQLHLISASIIFLQNGSVM
jgi:hypothetical protein